MGGRWSHCGRTFIHGAYADEVLVMIDETASPTPKLYYYVRNRQYNVVGRPPAALDGRTPEEAWEGIKMPAPIPIRAADPDEIAVRVQRRSYRGGPALPIITIRAAAREAA